MQMEDSYQKGPQTEQCTYIKKPSLWEQKVEEENIKSTPKKSMHVR